MVLLIMHCLTLKFMRVVVNRFYACKFLNECFFFFNVNVFFTEIGIPIIEPRNAPLPLTKTNKENNQLTRFPPEQWQMF